MGRDDRGIRGEKEDQQTKMKKETKNNTRELESYSLRVDNTNDSIKYSKYEHNFENNFEHNFDDDKRDDKLINSKENENDDDRLGGEARRSDCDVQGNNNKTFCENSIKTSEADKDEDKPDYEVYNFKDSRDGKSWLLGNDTLTKANAFKGGYSKCPVDIIVPRELKNEKGETKPVEVIGQSAYSYCSYPKYGDKTKTVLVTKQVRIIKYLGFGSMWNVESFRIEEGSVLESIDNLGLHYIGYKTGQNDAKKRGTLTLPSTLLTVAENGFHDCNLFKVIIYCGTHPLTEKSELYYGSGVEATMVRVTNQYSGSTIFGYDALKDSPTEVEGNCSQMEQSLTPPNVNKDCSCSSLSRVISSVFLSCFLLVDSYYDFDFSLQADREIEDSKNKEGRRGRGIKRGNRNLSSFGFETEVFLVITNRKKGHSRGVDENQISKFKLMNNTRFPNWWEG